MTTEPGQQTDRLARIRQQIEDGYYVVEPSDLRLALRVIAAADELAKAVKKNTSCPYHPTVNGECLTCAALATYLRTREGTE